MARAPRVDDQGAGAEAAWFVYVLWSETAGRTYVGISTEPDRRLAQHNGQRVGGARATRAGRPWVIGACYGPYPDRAAASREELRVKTLRGRQRLSAAPVIDAPI